MKKIRQVELALLPGAEQEVDIAFGGEILGIKVPDETSEIHKIVMWLLEPAKAGEYRRRIFKVFVSEAPIPDNYHFTEYVGTVSGYVGTFHIFEKPITEKSEIHKSWGGLRSNPIGDIRECGNAPACDVCGSITVKQGLQYTCVNCGNAMGAK